MNKRINVTFFTPHTVQRVESIQKAFKELGITYVGRDYNYVEDRVTLIFDASENDEGNENDN